MYSPQILALATGNPPDRHSQEEIFTEFLGLLGKKYPPRRQRAMQTIFEKSGVRFRHTTVQQGYFTTPRSTRTRNDLYMQAALPLGEGVIQKVLNGYDRQQIDDLILVSCTGWNTPGLDLQLAGRLGLRPDLHRTSILGMGCYGSFPGMLRAFDAARTGRTALVLALELCSLHWQLDDAAHNVVSSALFADGAGAVLIGQGQAGTRYPYILHTATHCDYNTLEHMTFEMTDEGFRMYLSSYVPDLLAAKIETFVDKMLGECGVERGKVRFWGIHPGSSKIVDHIQAQLKLKDEQVRFSHDVLANYGNMSSATILFVLDEIQRCGKPRPGDYGVLLAFGPGLTMEGMLLRW